MNNYTLSPVYRYYFTTSTSKKNVKPMSSAEAKKQERTLILQRISAQLGM